MAAVSLFVETNMVAVMTCGSQNFILFVIGNTSFHPKQEKSGNLSVLGNVLVMRRYWPQISYSFVFPLG